MLEQSRSLTPTPCTCPTSLASLAPCSPGVCMPCNYPPLQYLYPMAVVHLPFVLLAFCLPPWYLHSAEHLAPYHLPYLALTVPTWPPLSLACPAPPCLCLLTSAPPHDICTPSTYIFHHLASQHLHPCHLALPAAFVVFHLPPTLPFTSPSQLSLWLGSCFGPGHRPHAASSPHPAMQ